MHVIFRESHGLEETAQPVDLQQTPADMVVLSFSDSDLGAFSVGWHNAKEDLPSLRLANLAALQHPLSVDTYIEQTLRDAKAVLVRLIGGMPYWSYGLQQLRAVAEENGIAWLYWPLMGGPIASWMISPPCPCQHCAGCASFVTQVAPMRQAQLWHNWPYLQGYLRARK